MARTAAFCSLGIVTGTEVCGEPPSYRLEARAGESKSVLLQLCSIHVHRAWHLAQLAMNKRYPFENPKVRSIHLHQIKRPVKAIAEAAS
ncbi:MAG: hypothetical protein JOZ10_17710 [Acidobacteria bacterium]|nr:hypothetical protein [Acidobacteriota bacterium]MBV9145355.1 hypothetical protein [Acidobacteriota bacterium]MBV9437119.1 hypothetical protein [Acidobacteriota bacterium]